MSSLLLECQQILADLTNGDRDYQSTVSSQVLWARAVELERRIRLSTEPGEAVLVPREPTEAMLTAAALADHDGYDNDAAGVYREMWQAMLAAAPLPEDTHHGR